MGLPVVLPVSIFYMKNTQKLQLNELTVLLEYKY